MSIEREKEVAAEAAAELVEDGMTVGLGTGSTVAFLLPALARRSLDIVCAATSPRTEHAARQLGLRMEAVASIDRFDLTIDGADQIAPDGWLVKGGGAAHTREKIIAGAADRFMVIADSTKPVQALHSPVSLELLSFGLRATMRRVGPVSLRDVPPSPDGGVIADYHGPGQVFALTDRRGRPVLARAFRQRQVPELGVRHQRPVDEQGAADPRPEGYHGHRAGHAPSGPEADPGDARRVGVVQHRDRLAGHLREKVHRVDADPGWVDVGRGLDDPAPDHRRDGQTDRAGHADPA